jgi:hypothetical protein
MPAPCEHDANTVPIGLVTDSLIPDSLIPDSSTSAERAVISMPLSDGTEFGVTQECIDEWTSAYPAIRVLPELAKMRSWCIANRAKRKTRRGIMAFCNRWLSSAHDRGGTIPPSYETAKTRELMQKTEWIDAITGRNKQPEIIDITPTLGREAP